MDLELTDKTAIITGGSRGIGKAIARELSHEGVTVAISSRNHDELEATAEELASETGGRILALVVDTGDGDSVRAMVERAHAELGRIDILVNNAAAPGSTLPPAKLEDLTDNHFWPDLNVKVLGYMRCAQAVAPIMKKQGWGRIINVSGLAARRSGNPVGSVRNVSVSALTKNLADELGPHGINVTVVHPGATRTERTAKMVTARATERGISEEAAEQQLAVGNSIHHLVDAREVAYVVTFLASPKSIAINGDTIAAGGGLGNAIHY